MLALLPILAAASAVNADIRPLLRAQGFDGPLNGREIITYAGHIRQGRSDFHVYTYRGVFRAAAVDHGVNWIIVVRGASTLVGAYRIPIPASCKVRRVSVKCQTEAPGEVTFNGNGPPHKILFDGEIIELTRFSPRQR